MSDLRKELGSRRPVSRAAPLEHSSRFAVFAVLPHHSPTYSTCLATSRISGLLVNRCQSRASVSTLFHDWDLD